METGKGEMRCGGHRLQRRRLLPSGNFSSVQSHTHHHERRHRPASDHPQDKEEEKCRAGRRSRLLRLQEKEEGSRRLSLCPDGRTGGFLEHKGLSGILSHPSKSPVSLNVTRSESLRLLKQRQEIPILSPPRPHLPSPPAILPPPRLILLSNNLRLPRDDHQKHPQRLSHIRNC